jgi:O-succinylbenzoic acid--CoA ligase
MYHVGGLSHAFRSALHGTASVVQEGFDAEETVDNIAEYDVTQVSLVPTMLRRLLDTGRASELGGLRYVLLGGAPATDDLLRDCAEAGVPVSPTYGMTETASQVATVTPGSLPEDADPDCVGPPLVSTRVRILDDEGRVLGDGETGEVVVSGPTVTEGYYAVPRETEEAFCEHGLMTGDIGYIDKSGHLHVVGRKDDIIITGGEKVSPDEVADIVLKHPSVEDAAVFGVEDHEWGQRVCALVVAGDGDEEPDIEEFCSERLAAYKRPRTVVFVDQIPRTPSGTVDRDEARDLVS